MSDDMGGYTVKRLSLKPYYAQYYKDHTLEVTVQIRLVYGIVLLWYIGKFAALTYQYCYYYCYCYRYSVGYNVNDCQACITLD